MNEHSVGLDGSGRRVGIVAGRFNDAIVRQLLQGALDELTRHGCEDVEVVWVPGAFEVPFGAKLLAESGQVDAVVALGAVIRGATPHFEHVAGQAAAGVSRVGLDSGVPVVFGVLTTNTIEEALERSGSKLGNKGSEAARAAIEMANLTHRLRKR